MKLRSCIAVVAVAFLTFGATCPTADAAVIYDNIGNGGNGFFGVSSNDWRAQRFNSDATNLKLSDVTLSLALPTARGNFSLSLYSDVANHPGASVGTLFSGTTTAAGVDPGGNVLFGGLTQAMSPNTNYWLVFSVAPGDLTTFGWEVTLNASGSGSGFQTASAGSTNQGLNWGALSAPVKTQINATVPEPSSVALVLFGIAGFLARCRRPANT